MKDPIIVIGLGELGSVFARGFLKTGHPVFPVTRDMDMHLVAQTHPNPKAVMVAVGESDLSEVLKNCPESWKNNLILIQNELLPRDWQAANIIEPTVISVWFEKKKGMDTKVVLPSPIFGANDRLLFDALASLDIPSFLLDTQAELNYELVRKNLYILTTNIAGLEVGGNVNDLMHQHASIMNAVAQDILDIQDQLTGQTQDRKRLMAGLIEAIKGDLNHGCMGRSAPARLKRALGFAKDADIKVPKLTDIAHHYVK